MRFWNSARVALSNMDGMLTPSSLCKLVHMTVRRELTQWLAMAAFLGVCNNPVALTTGLTGTVRRGPITPVCQINVPCDAPFSASFDVLRGSLRVASFRSDANGHFTIALAPGTYVIVPAADAPLMNPSAQTKTVEVSAEGISSVELMFDTGIR